MIGGGGGWREGGRNTKGGATVRTKGPYKCCMPLEINSTCNTDRTCNSYIVLVMVIVDHIYCLFIVTVDHMKAA